MTQLRTDKKAHALRKTGAAALIIAAVLTLALLFTACPNAHNDKPAAHSNKPKYKVTFSVDGGGGAPLRQR